MQSPELFDTLPDLVLLVKRDGTPIAHAGGKGVSELGGSTQAGPFVPTWSESTTALVGQLARKAIATRTPAEARFREREEEYEIRVNPQGPDRAICVIRPVLHAPADASLDATGEHRPFQLDRRGFLRRFKESISV